MNHIADEILSYYGIAIDLKALEHYGMPRRSGRYPWGSGENPYQRTGDFLGRVEELKRNGWEETPENIKKEFGLNTTQYRIEKAICKDERRMLKVARAKSLKEDGLGDSEIGRIMGINESSVRSLLKSTSEAKMKAAKNTADFIKKRIDESEYGLIDIGVGVEKELGISKEKLNQAIYMLERQGYVVVKSGIPQPTNPGQQTNQKIICPPGTPYKINSKGEKVSTVAYEFDKIEGLNEPNYTSRDNGESFETFRYPKSMDSNRLAIRYKEDGGALKDGIVEIRRGVDDLSLGNSKYAQVRILVDDNKFIKGMAVYGDNFPEGVDVIFNTNKTKDISKLDVLKDIKSNPDNPFGSYIKAKGQSEYIDKNGEKQLSLINKTREEKDWSEWKDALPSQFLSKQSKTLAVKQLNLAKADKLAEYEEICKINNPTIKKHLLGEFADNCDAAAVHLKAAALPGQKHHVILPINSLKDTEVYAPNYKPGTKLALIRYPHGGIFEIPILTVNNKNQEGRRLIGSDSIDAIGINSNVAERLSGADFDGDTVMCIPTHDKFGKVKINSKGRLEQLVGFDPKTEYGPATYEGRNVRLLTKEGTQPEMGKISNLITDMTLAGAPDEDLARAVKHSMVIIDAEKHKLDYKRSEAENNIDALNRKWRRYVDEDGNIRYSGGASTIISKAKSDISVLKRQGLPKVNIKGEDWYDPNRPEGALIYKLSTDLYYPDRKRDKKTGLVSVTKTDGKKILYDDTNPEEKAKYKPVRREDAVTGKISYTNYDGSIKYRTLIKKQQSTKMAETDDAMTLVSAAKHPMEIVYAEYANSMKALANRARKEMYNTGKIEYDAQAHRVYHKEVSSLMKKLDDAELNRTRERAAIRRANVVVNSKIKAYPDMSKGDIRKEKQRAVDKARVEVGSIPRKERNIVITDKEWEAVQAGAISETQLKRILNNSDIDRLRELATPKSSKGLSSSQISRIKAYANSNYTIEQIAAKMGVSSSTVAKYLKGA